MNEMKIYMNVYLEDSYFNEHSDDVCALAERILMRATDYATDNNASREEFRECVMSAFDDEFIYYDDMWSVLMDYVRPDTSTIRTDEIYLDFIDELYNSLIIEERKGNE